MKRVPVLLIIALLFLLLSPPVAGMAHPGLTGIANPGYSPETSDLGYSAVLQGGAWGDGPVVAQDLQVPLDTQAIGPDTLYWRTGMVSHAAFPSYNSLTMRDPTAVARFQSNAGVTNMFFVLGAASRWWRVADAKVYMLSRSGSYIGEATIELWRATMGGSPLGQVSMYSVDLEDMSLGSWRTISLAKATASRRIATGESLLVFFHLSDTAGGSLDVRTIYEVTLTTHLYEIYLPMMRNTSAE